jgi:hypothetical protein
MTRARNLVAALSLLTAAGALVPSAAAQTTFYQQNFQSGSYWSEWSVNQHIESGNAVFTRFLGRYGNGSVFLTVPTPPGYPRGDNTEPPPPPETQTRLLLAFDLYAIDSWDGSEPTLGEDHFIVRAGGVTIFDETFANVHDFQSYSGPATIARQHIGYDSRWPDSIYRIAIPFDVPVNTISLEFNGYGLQVLNDESWGIDNVTLSTIVVPAPTGAGVLAVGALVAMRRRRR